MSQEALALAMREAGFPWRQTTAAKTEAGDRPVRVNEASALAQVFDVPLVDLLAEEGSAGAESLVAARRRARQQEEWLAGERESLAKSEQQVAQARANMTHAVQALRESYRELRRLEEAQGRADRALVWLHQLEQLEREHGGDITAQDPREGVAGGEHRQAP